MIDLEDETTFKTLRVINALYRHSAEKHCHHTYSQIIKEALKTKSDGLAARSQHQQTQQPPEVNLNGNYKDRIY